MTAFTRTWDVAYEAIPPDTQNVKQGASRIRNTRLDVRERLVVDHSWAGNVDDGFHKQVTLVDPLGAKPTQINDETYIYSKDVAGTAELFFEDEAGNEIQITGTGKFNIDNIYPVGAIYISTVSTSPATLFGGTWTALGDREMLIHQGSIAAGSTGGSKDAINVSHTHTDTFSTASDGAHTHTVPSGSGVGTDAASLVNQTASLITTNSTGGHTHTINGSVDSSGASGTDANLPPYLSVYMWERTA